MNAKPFPFFPEYLDYLRFVEPNEVVAVLDQMCNLYWNGQTPNLEGFSNAAKAGISVVTHGIRKSMEIRRVRTEAGAIGGAHGKGVSRNFGNSNAAGERTIANNSKTIANKSNEKQNNSKSKAKQNEVEDEVEGRREKGEDCSCRSSPVQSAPARMRTLGELVSEDEIIKFSLPLRHPDEDADWYEGTLREHYQFVEDTPVRTTWQTLWRAAINDLRKNGAFVVPVGIDSSSDSFA